MEPNPDISAPIKRQAQQRCGYGCIVCGHPIARIEQLAARSSSKEVAADNVVLLCVKHTDDKVEGRLTDDALSTASEQPYNTKQGITAPFNFHYEGTDQKLVLGENVFTNDITEGDTAIVPLLIDGAGIVGLIIEDGKVFVNINLFDEDDRLILRIEENELVIIPDSYEVIYENQALVIRDGENVILDINFATPGTVLIKQAEIRCRGIWVRIQSGVMAVLNNKNIIRNATFNNVPVAVSLGDSPEPELQGAVNMPDIERFGIDWEERDAWFRHETMWF